jgi:tetratricopeptide (TPR) repeat protein
MRSRYRLFPAGILILLWPWPYLSGSPDRASARDEVTVMEPVFVEASSPDPWIYFTVPGFEVISHCPDSFNEIYAHALRMATAARLAVLPASFWGDLPTPMKIVLYDRRPEPREGFGRGSPIDLSWASGDGSSVGTGAIQRSFPVTVGDGDTFINCGNYWAVQASVDNFSVDPDSEIRLEERVPRLPSWFVSGIEGQFGLYPDRIIQSSPFSSTVVLPSATWISSLKTLAVLKEAREKHKNDRNRRPRAMLPLGEIFSGHVRADSQDLWNSEAALLVRWGLYGSGNRQGFLDFVDRATRVPATEELFQKYLGFGYGEAQRRLSDYLLKAVGEPISVPIVVRPEKRLEVREASSVEVARIIGDWGRLEARTLGFADSDYQRECLDQADRLFERIHRRANSDPLFLAAFGLYELQVGDEALAREALEGATRAGVVRPRAYLELARMRLDDSLPSIQEGIGDLDEADFSEINGLLTTARVQMPSLLATYDLIARVLAHAPKKPDREQIRPLEEAIALFPQNAALASKLAGLYRDVGLSDEAAAVIARALRFSDSDQSRALLADTLSRKSK